MLCRYNGKVDSVLHLAYKEAIAKAAFFGFVSVAKQRCFLLLFSEIHSFVAFVKTLDCVK